MITFPILVKPIHSTVSGGAVARSSDRDDPLPFVPLLKGKGLAERRGPKMIRHPHSLYRIPHALQLPGPPAFAAREMRVGNGRDPIQAAGISAGIQSVTKERVHADSAVLPAVSTGARCPIAQPRASAVNSGVLIR